MLLARVNPPAITTRQESAFSQPTHVSAEWMLVFTERYTMGDEKARFTALFGILVPDGIDKFRFERVHAQGVELTSQELSDWGTDDSIVFTKVADKLGISVVEVANKDVHNGF